MRRLIARSLVAPALAAVLLGPAPAAAQGVVLCLLPPPRPPVPAADPPVEVTVCGGEFFGPRTIEVDVGETVRWTNLGAAGPTVSSTVFGSGPMAAGEEYSVTFDEEGTFVFRNEAHPDPDAGAGVVVVGDGVPPPPEPRQVIRVPQDKPAITSAVAAAGKGALILVSDGVYREEVSISGGSKRGITIRGESRNGTILDGTKSRNNGIRITNAPGVTVEDLTIRNYLTNGLFFSYSDRFLGDRVKSIDNEIYGIYAFHAVDGVFRNSYASGSGDAGFYIGECEDCRDLIAYSVVEKNVIGYSGTNARNVTIRDSEWRGNAVAIAPNSLAIVEDYFPPKDGTIVGNWIHDNNGWDVKRKGFPAFFDFPSGTGIWLAGAVGWRVDGNLVERHDRYGIVATWLSNTADDNVIRRNAVSGSTKADLAWDGLGHGTCFIDNSFTRSLPPMAETLYDCELPTTVGVPYPLIDADIYYGTVRRNVCPLNPTLDSLCPREIPFPPVP